MRQVFGQLPTGSAFEPQEFQKSKGSMMAQSQME
jgi:hypothetical protein